MSNQEVGGTMFQLSMFQENPAWEQFLETGDPAPVIDRLPWPTWYAVMMTADQSTRLKVAKALPNTTWLLIENRDIIQLFFENPSLSRSIKSLMDRMKSINDVLWLLGADTPEKLNTWLVWMQCVVEINFDSISIGNWSRLLKKSMTYDLIAQSMGVWDRLNCYQIAEILENRPELTDFVVENHIRKFEEAKPFSTSCCDASDYMTTWVNLMTLSPRFDELFLRVSNWESLYGSDWARLLSKRPDLDVCCEANRGFKIMDNTDWVSLITHRPELISRPEMHYRDRIKDCHFGDFLKILTGPVENRMEVWRYLSDNSRYLLTQEDESKSYTNFIVSLFGGCGQLNKHTFEETEQCYEEIDASRWAVILSGTAENPDMEHWVNIFKTRTHYVRMTAGHWITIIHNNPQMIDLFDEVYREYPNPPLFTEWDWIKAGKEAPGLLRYLYP